MKRILCLVFALALALYSMCSCFKSKESSGSGEDTTVSSLPEYTGKIVADYDEQGNFILTSTDERKVYLVNSPGNVREYAVFTFSGEAVTKVQTVICFSSADEAEDYVSANAKSAIDAGKIPDEMTVNGTYVITKVGFNADKDSLGNFYAKSKTDVINMYEQEVTQ